MTRRLVAPLLGLAALLTLTACGGGDDAPAAGFRVRNLTLTPTTLTFAGGPVQLTCDVLGIEADLIQRVFAEVTYPSGRVVQVDLAGGAGYAGTITAPVNGRTDGLSETTTVVVRAVATTGQSAASATAIVTVTAPPAPPSTPTL